MRLSERITITLGSEEIHLTPRLRFAMRLERRPGSFGAVVRQMSEDSLSSAIDMIGDHVPMTPKVQEAILDALPSLKSPLIAYVMACAGIDPDDAPANEGKTSRKSIPFAEYLTGLYRVGTGWLGWTPTVTLNATPAEIIEAQKGRLEMLKAIFGGSEEPASEMPLDEKAKAVFAGFTTVKVKRKKGA